VPTRTPSRTAPSRSAALTVHGLGVALDVTVVRRRMRRIYLRVLPPDGRVVVSAPLRASDRAIREAVLADLGWVLRNRDRIIEEERRDALTRPPVARGVAAVRSRSRSARRRAAPAPR
jgi:predicted metal-dependent hydrolase